MSGGWIDVSVPVRSGMVHWPGDPEIAVERIHSIADGDMANVSKLEMCAHTGTHMDAPLHFVEGGAGIDSMPLEEMIGPARVIEIADPAVIAAAELAEHSIGAGERILLKTANSPTAWRAEGFQEEFVHLATESAELLAGVGVALVGVDYLSVAGYERNEREVHRALLEAGVWLLEGLDLTDVGAGDYELACLPMRLVGSDGAPARALVRPL